MHKFNILVEPTGHFLIDFRQELALFEVSQLVKERSRINLNLNDFLVYADYGGLVGNLGSGDSAPNGYERFLVLKALFPAELLDHFL
jgi:hypothetical protein